MRLTVLGCSGSGPGPDLARLGLPRRRPATPGSRSTWATARFGALQRHLDPWLLDAVVFSHLHADHCARLRLARGAPPLPPARARSTRRAAAGVRPRRGAGPARRRLRAVARRSGRRPTCPTCFAFRTAADGGGRGRRRRGAGRRRSTTPARRTRCASSTAARAWSTAATPARARRWSSWPRAPTCCSARRSGRTSSPGRVGRSRRRAAHVRPPGGRARARRRAWRLLLTHVPSWCDPAALLAEAQDGLRRAGRGGRAGRQLRPVAGPAARAP